MKINYSFLFALPLLLIMFIDNMFMELAAPNSPETQAALLNKLVKGTAGLAFVYSAMKFNRMTPPMRFAFVATTLFILAMSFESYYKYNSFFIYPHVFLKVLVFYYSFFVYTYYKGSYHLQFHHVVWFIMIGFWLNVLLVNPHTLSVSSFTNNERGVHSTSVYMMVIPFLYFLNNYFFRGKITHLFWAFFVFITIFFFQHRTVWISTAIILAVYYLLIRFKSPVKINYFSKLMPVAVVMGIGGVLSSAFIFSMYPEIIDRVQESISDIQNYDKQGTGGWRYNQFLSYLPFIQENWLVGMRFEGFELPIQFYRDDINAPVFEDGNGHFFHSFYVDVLFYAGSLGLLLFLLQFGYGVYKTLRQPKLTEHQIILAAFTFSGIIFGLSYILPIFFYAVMGWTIVAIEEDGKQEVSSYLPDFARRRRERIRELQARLQHS